MVVLASCPCPGRLQPCLGFCLPGLAGRPRLERLPAKIGGALLARTRGRVPVPSAHRAEPAAVLPAQRLHGQREARFRLEEGIEIDGALVVHVRVEVVRTQLLLVSPPWIRHEARFDGWRDRDVESGQAAAAGLRNPGRQRSVDEHRVPVSLERERRIVEHPGGILKWTIERLGAVDPQAFFRDIRYANSHVLSALTFYIY